MRLRKAIIYILIIFLVFYSFRAWMFVGQDTNWDFILGPILIFLVITNSNFFSFAKQKIYFIIITFVVLWLSRDLHDLGGVIGTIFKTSCLYSIILLKKKYQRELIAIFDNIMTYVTAFSVIGWIMYLFHVPLPHHDFIWIATEDSYYEFQNYYLFLFCVQENVITIFPRFSSIFYEPGYSAIILVFLILYNKYNFKLRSVQIYTIALIFTFSLSGYLMFFIFWLGISITKSKQGIPYLLLMIVILYGGKSFFSTYNNGNNPVNELIIARMAIEDGDWTGYNRTGKTFDDEFEDFINKGGSNLYKGVPKGMLKNLDKGNVGWKVYIYEYGLRCFIPFIFSIILMVSCYRNKKKNIMPALLYFLTFARGHLLMWSSGFWLLWICTMAYFDNIEEEKEKQ